ncbi:MAG: guanylate kinase [Arenicellales bacterium]|jgi:guanylate kinase
MQKTRHPVILIISGPSGAGKSTLSHALIDAVPDTVIAVSHTTRKPRPGEENGIDYFFVSQPDFLNLINSGDMLEYAEVYDNLYGTSRESIDQPFSEGKNIILDIDWQGARRIKAIYPDAISVQILPPGEKESEKRLISRQQDSKQTIMARMATYKEQMSHQDEYDHIIINDDLAEATRQLISILPLS